MALESLKKILDLFGRSFIFERWREPLRQYFLKAGFERTPYGLFGLLFFLVMGVVYGLFLAFLPFLVTYNPVVKGLASLIFWIAVPCALIALLVLIVLFFLNLRVYARVREMEAALPEYLQLVVTNLKSGMNLDQSLWNAARPEFGILSKEITIVSKKVLTGNDTADALREFAQRYDSPTLSRSFDLIVSEIQAGGKIVRVIERVIDSLKRTTALKDEMSASVLNFIIFISVIVCVLTPILFALANTLLGVMIGFAGLLGASAGGAGSALGGGGAAFATKLSAVSKNGAAIKQTFLYFSYAAIGVIALFSSMIVSIIEKGDITGGVRYIPIFLAVSLFLFSVFVNVFVSVFSGIVG